MPNPSIRHSFIQATSPLMGTASGSVTRPANTTQYTIGDSINTAAGAVIELDLGAESVKPGQWLILKKVTVHSTAAQGTLPQITVVLSPTSFLEADSGVTMTDNDALALPAATAKAAFPVACSTGITYATNSVCHSGAIDQPVKLAGTKLYAVLQAINAYTPISGEVFTVRLDFANA